VAFLHLRAQKESEINDKPAISSPMSKDETFDYRGFSAFELKAATVISLEVT